ncbi:unnamed protein product, partial [Adineta steineri]
MNNDNKTDIIIGNYDSTFQILFNEYNNKFYQSVVYLVKFYSTFLTIGDLNNDQRLDIILGNLGTKQISIHFNIGNRKFIKSIIYSTDFNPVAAKLVDINGDG